MVNVLAEETREAQLEHIKALAARARAVAEFEERYVRALLAATGGNASEAARRAQMDRPYLLELKRRHGLG